MQLRQANTRFDRIFNVISFFILVLINWCFFILIYQKIAYNTMWGIV